MQDMLVSPPQHAHRKEAALTPSVVALVSGVTIQGVSIAEQISYHSR